VGHPEQMGRYTIVGHLATGGMAEILLGKVHGPSGFERPVVIKRILPSLVSQPHFVNMFLDEAQVVARIQHPNVIHVHELGQDGDELYIVMEYLEGESLLSLLRRSAGRGEAIDRALGAHIVSNVCAGLHAAHELDDDHGAPLGLVHRDVSPSNVFLTYSGAVKVLDFGIAKFAAKSTDTEAGQVKGKFAYMSPEQCLAQPLDRRSDIFSLGTVLFELTTGRRLFARDSNLATMKAITEDRVRSPKEVDAAYPDRLARVCERALARDPAERYATAAEMRRELMRAIRELTNEEMLDEQLAQLMQRSFADRIAEKQELMRRVRSGSSITRVPAAEVDPAIELPAMISTRPSGTPIAIARANKPPFALIGLALVALLGLGAGVGGVIAFSGDESDREAALPRASSVTAAAQVTESAPLPAPPPVERGVEAPTPLARVHVSSTPPGATVLIAGRARGETPIDIDLPTSQSVEIEIARAGYRTERRTIRPVDGSLLEIALHRDRRGARTAPSEQEPPRQSGSPFRRFN
jgi:eukaryotic-like serine/threonine-protein kinase